MAFVEFVAMIWGSLIEFGRLFFGDPVPSPRRIIHLHNTLSGREEVFRPLEGGVVKMYNCGPTVYGIQHIGNLSMYVFTDILRRTLRTNDYKVKQVINITDVGHLVSDEDDGEDKMTKGLKREGMALTLESMRSLAEKYTELWLNDLQALNIETQGVFFPRASDHIPAQIKMVAELEKKGIAYRGKDGVYFDTSKFPQYGKLGNINLKGLQEGARVATASDKRNPTDFLLWKFDSKLGWESPWGMGFPGWHIECSAMIREILGDQIDIHTGGIEHIPVHHNNEIAQTEAATGKKPFSRFWLHRAHLQVDGGKMAKSEGTVFYLSDIVEKGFHPLAFRYLLLSAHYRQPSNFTWEALEAAQKAFLRLVKLANELPEDGTAPFAYVTRFFEHINNNLDTPGALAVLWEMVNDKTLAPEDVRAGLMSFDDVLGLNLTEPDERALSLSRKEYGASVELEDVPVRVKELLEQRELARMERRWADADQYRADIEGEGYVIEDTSDGPRVVAKY